MLVSSDVQSRSCQCSQPRSGGGFWSVGASGPHEFRGPECVGTEPSTDPFHVVEGLLGARRFRPDSFPRSPSWSSSDTSHGFPSSDGSHGVLRRRGSGDRDLDVVASLRAIGLSRFPHSRRSAPCLHPTPKIRSKRRHFRGLHGSQSNHQLRPRMRCRVMRPQPTLSHCRLAQLLQAPWVLPSLGRQALLLHMSRLDHPRSRRGFLCRKLRPNARRIHRRMTKRRHSVCHRPTPYHPNWC